MISENLFKNWPHEAVNLMLYVNLLLVINCQIEMVYYRNVINHLHYDELFSLNKEQVVNYAKSTSMRDDLT